MRERREGRGRRKGRRKARGKEGEGGERDTERNRKRGSQGDREGGGGEKGREGWIFVKRADKTSKSWDDETLEGKGKRGSLRSYCVLGEITALKTVFRGDPHGSSVLFGLVTSLEHDLVLYWLLEVPVPVK